ncbi:anti-phage dCTP deaminase [Devosia alba]|uniref:anti-phage dCTP deaminase n=1 Tax=Devosia alba TaxID=3152360 RepID=UPI0032648E86
MLTEIEFPEIFIGLVSPIGVDTQDVDASIASYFKAEGYSVIHIKVTDSFRRLKEDIVPLKKLENSPFYERIDSHIEYGNYVRKKFNDNSILASAAVSLIFRQRWKSEVANRLNPALPSYERRVYIISQFKRKEEVDLLRQVYGAQFFQISVYSRRETRIKYLSAKIEADKRQDDKRPSEDLARYLVARDEDESREPFGQRVTSVFHDADFIVNVEAQNQTIDRQVERFGELLFGSNVISPTKSEYGMYSAKVAALRTLDLSRQVGAAIFSPGGEIISLGANEVPKAGGGTYWADGGGYDAREYVLKKDSNDEKKRLVVREMYSLAMGTQFEESKFQEFIERDDVKNSRAMDAIEYGRIVHAEMNAVTDAARLGRNVQDAVLYCTTFPCHVCAKHIVASGVKRVVYLEPYPKSLAQDLHPDSISVDGSERGRFSKYPVVEFEHFYGVTPRRYREFFERGKRKADGRLQNYIKGRKIPIIRIIQPSYVNSEKLCIKAGFAKLHSLKGQN